MRDGGRRDPAILRSEAPSLHGAGVRRVPARDSQDAFDKLCEIVETERQRDEAKAENVRLRAGRKRWYVCGAGIFEGELNQVTLLSADTRPGDWVMPEKYCFLTREAAEADAAEEAAEAAKENTGV